LSLQNDDGKRRCIFACDVKEVAQAHKRRFV
jgi:hypothetical protein